MKISHAACYAALMIVASACEQQAPQPTETLSPWPFNVPQVTLSCGPPGSMQIFVTTLDGRRFAANGSARSDAPLMTPIQAHYSTRAVIERGLALCKAKGLPIQLLAPKPDASSTAQLAAPEFTVKPLELGEGLDASAEAGDAVDGKRPRLALLCEKGKAPYIFLDLIRAPATPPPLRGVFGVFQIDDATPIRLELSWSGSEGQWSLRSSDGRPEDRQLKKAILTGGRVTLNPPSEYSEGKPIAWDTSRFGTNLDAIKTACD